MIEDKYKQLKKNQQFKNYKALCEFLAEKEKGGGAKKAQLGRWEKYFTWKKEKHSYIITKIYSKPLPEVSEREYNTEIKSILIDLLEDSTDENGIGNKIAKAHMEDSKQTLIQERYLDDDSSEDAKEQVATYYFTKNNLALYLGMFNHRFKILDEKMNKNKLKSFLGVGDTEGEKYEEELSYEEKELKKALLPLIQKPTRDSKVDHEITSQSNTDAQSNTDINMCNSGCTNGKLGNEITSHTEDNYDTDLSILTEDISTYISYAKNRIYQLLLRNLNYLQKDLLIQWREREILLKKHCDTEGKFLWMEHIESTLRDEVVVKEIKKSEALKLGYSNTTLILQNENLKERYYKNVNKEIKKRLGYDGAYSIIKINFYKERIAKEYCKLKGIDYTDYKSNREKYIKNGRDIHQLTDIEYFKNKEELSQKVCKSLENGIENNCKRKEVDIITKKIGGKKVIKAQGEGEIEEVSRIGMISKEEIQEVKDRNKGKIQKIYKEAREEAKEIIGNKKIKKEKIDKQKKLNKMCIIEDKVEIIEDKVEGEMVSSVMGLPHIGGKELHNIREKNKTEVKERDKKIKRG